MFVIAHRLLQMIPLLVDFFLSFLGASSPVIHPYVIGEMLLLMSSSLECYLWHDQPLYIPLVCKTPCRN